VPNTSSCQIASASLALPVTAAAVDGDDEDVSSEAVVTDSADGCFSVDAELQQIIIFNLI